MDRSRHCSRPGCGGAAAAGLTYQYASRIAWLDSLDAEDDPNVMDLCSTHADSLKVPVGWALEDRRTPIIPLRAPIAV